jgi:[acyl-carrier-protein] S-malonyltransferase
MEPARAELAKAIEQTEIRKPKCPIYQNVTARPETDPEEIKKNLVAQLTGAVKWTQTVNNMIASGVDSFTEIGPGAVLQGLVKKVDRKMVTAGIGTYEQI